MYKSDNKGFSFKINFNLRLINKISLNTLCFHRKKIIKLLINSQSNANDAPNSALYDYATAPFEKKIDTPAVHDEGEDQSRLSSLPNTALGSLMRKTRQ